MMQLLHTRHIEARLVTVACLTWTYKQAIQCQVKGIHASHPIGVWPQQTTSAAVG
jgi:hypothetical protein